MHIARSALVVLLSSLVTSACYHYVPAELNSIPMGTKVEAILTPAGAEEMTRFFGPGTTRLDGPLAGVNGGGVSILRESRLYQVGMAPTTLTDTIFLDARYIERLGVQKLNGTKTALFTAAMVGLGAGSILAARIFGGTGDEPDEGVPPPDDSVIIFSIPLGSR